MTRETGKPIKMSRNELNGLLGRIDFFLKEADDTLERAQARRLDRICVKLDLRPSDHLVEIGTGWGGMAIHAAKHYGCRVTKDSVTPVTVTDLALTAPITPTPTTPVPLNTSISSPTPNRRTLAI